jgi:hypothetical protein
LSRAATYVAKQNTLSVFRMIRSAHRTAEATSDSVLGLGLLLLGWARSAKLSLELALKSANENGFADGDDAFDTTVGFF